MKTCFFIGDHDAPDSLQEYLNAEVERLVRFGDVTEFFVGEHGNFDRMATIAVQQVKKTRPDLDAYRLVAYHPSEQRVSLPEFFDHIYYPEGLEDTPRRYAIPKANRLILEETDVLVAYVRLEGTNAGNLLKTARRMERKGYLQIINLADDQSFTNMG